MYLVKHSTVCNKLVDFLAYSLKFVAFSDAL